MHDLVNMEADDTEAVTIRVVDLRKGPLGSKLLALFDVAIMIAGVEFLVRGLRVSREVVNGVHATSVTSPLHRDTDGRWAGTVSFSPEILQSMTDIVLDACIDAGVCRRVEEA
ncbi:hypothetical protein D3877_29045 [Azospirillum cavernae]|uniref:Uncharacterized protein n=1 Tax=Azospirillum cavernae TaxID=2320860 RepID=A0A418VJV9_9PROT|nr:hypothetical protein [Azospirillum cavernae]RJF76434.1 hypothetical protein D3877_29045 [Azospirillum cavernae]